MPVLPISPRGIAPLRHFLSGMLYHRTRVRRRFRCHVIYRTTIAVLGTAFLLSTFGCVTTPGARSSIWPTKPVTDPTSIGGPAVGNTISSKLGSAAQSVKGQFASVGTAVSSAYGKTKTAVASALVPASVASSDGSNSDPTNLANSPANADSLGPEINVITGQMYESNGQYDKAMDFYSKALEAESTNVAALSSLARLHDRQNNPDKAIEFYRAHPSRSESSRLYAELGTVHGRHGRMGVAKDQIQKAINLDPKNRSYRSQLAGILVDEGFADKAVDELQQVDGPAMSNYQMAYLYMSRQNIPLARQYLTKALTIDPNLQPARDMLNSLGGPQLAQQADGMMQQANQLYQQSGQIYQQVGQLGASVQNAYSTSHVQAPPSTASTQAPVANRR